MLLRTLYMYFDDYEDQNESEMDRQEETTTSSWGLGKLGGFFKRLTGETPITEDELTPVVDSLKKKVDASEWS